MAAGLCGEMHAHQHGQIEFDGGVAIVAPLDPPGPTTLSTNRMKPRFVGVGYPHESGNRYR